MRDLIYIAIIYGLYQKSKSNQATPMVGSNKMTLSTSMSGGGLMRQADGSIANVTSGFDSVLQSAMPAVSGIIQNVF